MTICIVDPDKKHRDSLDHLFKSFGAETEVFETGNQYLSSKAFSNEHVTAISTKQMDMDGFDLLRLSKNKGKAIAIFALLDEASVPETVRAMRIGVSDVLTKPATVEPIIRASRLGRGFKPDAEHSDTDNFPAEKPLSVREREVLDYLLAGKTSREIAGKLKISTRTAEAHRKNIYAKIGVRSKVDLIRKLNC